MDYSDSDAYRREEVDDVDPWADEDRDIDARFRFPRMSDRLDTPLLTTHHIMLTMVLTGARSHPEISSHAPLAPVQAFWQAYRASQTMPQADLVPSSEATILDLAEAYRHIGPRAARPRRTPLADAVWDRARKGFARRQVEIGACLTPSDQTWAALAAADSLRRDYDKARAELALVGRSASRRSHEVSHGRVRLFVTPEYSAYTVDGRVAHYGHTNHVQCALEILENQAGFLLARDLVRRSQHSVLTGDDILWVGRWQERVVRRYGTQGFPVAKAPEAMFKAQAGRTGARTIAGIDSLWQMGQKYRAKEATLIGFTGEYLVDELEGRARQTLVTDDACELSGVVRQCGYPIMDPLRSAGKSRALGAKPAEIRTFAMNDCVRIFSHLILKNYIEKHGRWPQLRDTTPTPTMLKSLCRNQTLNVPDGRYPISDWDHSEIVDIGTFDYHLDYLELLADKAAFEGLDNRQARYEGRLPDPNSRKLLLSVLDQTKIDVRADSEGFSRRTLHWSCYGANLAPKNQEFKPEARMFTLLHPTVRRALSVAQENVKSIFFPYMPYTSMAMGATELARELHAATKSHHTVKIELDLTSWNLLFNEVYCERLGYVMDRMAGVVSKFGQSHAFFRSSEFCVTVPGMRVEQLEDGSRRTDQSDALWTNDGAGKEGIEQRFWTLATVAMLYRAFWGEPYKFKLLGQGDNQTLVVDFGRLPSAQLAAETARMAAKIEAYCLQMNHVAKPEEFLVSATLLTYSKNFYEDGRELGMACKPGAKVTPSLNEVTPSLSSSVGGIYSAALSVARKALSPLDAWRLALVQAELYLRRVADRDAPFSTAEMAAVSRMLPPGKVTEAGVLALTVPACLGGFEAVTVSGFLVGGNPDPLSEAISVVKFFGPHSPGHRGLARWLSLDANYESSPDLTKLVENPFSIPIRLPATGAAPIRERVLSFLGACRNIDIAALAHTAMQTKEALKQSLVASRPLFPEIIADLYAMSSVGRADKIVGKFDSATSLAQTVMTPEVRSAYAATTQKRTNAECQWLMAAAAELGGTDITVGKWSWEVSMALRERWGGAGIIAGIDVAQPLDYEIVDTMGPGVVACRDAVVSSQVQGPHAPYFGSRTLERRSATRYEVEKAPVTADLAKLVLSYTAGSVDANVQRLYEEVALSRSGLPLARLCQIFPRTIGGTVAHRYDSLQSNGRIQPVGLPTWRSYVSTNTDNIPGVSASAVDYNFPVQSFLSLLTALHSVAMTTSSDPPRVLRHPLTSASLARLDETPRCSPMGPPGLPPMMDNPLVYTHDLKVVPLEEELVGRPSQGVVSRHPADAVAGIVFSQLACSGGGRLASEVGDASIGGVDVAATVSVGASRMLDGMVRGLALAGIWYCTWIVGRAGDRHTARLVVDNLSVPVARQLHSALARMSDELESLREEGEWIDAVGEQGRMASEAVLRRALRARALMQMADTVEVSRMLDRIILPSAAVGVPYAFTGRLCLALVAWTAMLIHDAPVLGALKQRVASATQAWKEEGLSSAATAASLMDYAADFALGLLPEEACAPEYDAVVMAATAGPRVMSGTVVDIWRKLRLSRPPRRSPAVFPRPSFAARAGTGEVLYALGQERMDLNPLLMLDDEVIAPAPEELVEDRMARAYVRQTTVAAAWAGMITPLKGPALVVGTGAGGVQRACAEAGVESWGLDLTSTMPLEQRAAWGSAPAEGQGLGGVHYARAMHTTDGDWLSPDTGACVMAEQEWRTIIVDIEAAQHRFGLAALGPLLDMAWHGHLHIRLLCTGPEAESVLASLLAATGTAGVTVRSMTGRALDECARPVLFSMRVSGRIGLVTRVRPVQVLDVGDWSPAPLRPECRAGAVQRLVSAISGGLVNEPTLDGALRVLRAELTSELEARGSKEHGTRLMAARAEVVLSRVQAAIDAEDPSILLRPVNWTTIGGMIIHENDKKVIYCLRKLAPHLMGVLMGTH